MTKIINLFGAPGAGKSTVAAELFAYMKKEKYSVELVTEYAKDLVWSERHNMFPQQDYIFAKQRHRIDRLVDKVDFVITDSPIILSAMYPEFVGSSWNVDTLSSFRMFVKQVYAMYDNINMFLERQHAYDPVGRNQTEEESDEISRRMLNWLGHHNIPTGEPLYAFEDVVRKVESII